MPEAALAIVDETPPGTLEPPVPAPEDEAPAASVPEEASPKPALSLDEVVGHAREAARSAEHAAVIAEIEATLADARAKLLEIEEGRDEAVLNDTLPEFRQRLDAAADNVRNLEALLRGQTRRLTEAEQRERIEEVERLSAKSRQSAEGIKTVLPALVAAMANVEELVDSLMLHRRTISTGNVQAMELRRQDLVVDRLAVERDIVRELTGRDDVSAPRFLKGRGQEAINAIFRATDGHGRTSWPTQWIVAPPPGAVHDNRPRIPNVALP